MASTKSYHHVSMGTECTCPPFWGSQPAVMIPAIRSCTVTHLLKEAGGCGVGTSAQFIQPAVETKLRSDHFSYCLGISAEPTVKKTRSP